MVIKQGLFKDQVLRKRIEMLNIDASQKDGILNRLTSDFKLSLT